MELDEKSEILELDFENDFAHIALCHKEQGYSANRRPNALIVKSKDQPLDETPKELLELAKSYDKKDKDEDDAESKKESLSEANSDSIKKNEDSSKPSDEDIKTKGNTDMSKDVNDKTPSKVELDETTKAKLAQVESLKSQVEEMTKTLEETTKLNQEILKTNKDLVRFKEETEKKKEEERLAKITAIIEKCSFIEGEEKQETVKALMSLKKDEQLVILSVINKSHMALDAALEGQGREDFEANKSAGKDVSPFESAFDDALDKEIEKAGIKVKGE